VLHTKSSVLLNETRRKGEFSIMWKAREKKESFYNFQMLIVLIITKDKGN